MEVANLEALLLKVRIKVNSNRTTLRTAEMTRLLYRITQAAMEVATLEALLLKCTVTFATLTAPRIMLAAHILVVPNRTLAYPREVAQQPGRPAAVLLRVAGITVGRTCL